MPNILFSTIASLIILCSVLGVSSPVDALDPQSESAERERPNIILINADDLGYADLGATGSDLIKTPNIDRLASEGAMLTNFFSSEPRCTPSRASLLTGRYAIRTGVGYDVLHPGSKHGMNAKEITLAENLKEVGYKTAVIGKWHLGHFAEYWPTNQGFDYFYGVPYSNDMLPFPLYRGTSEIENPADQSTLTKRYTEEAIRFIEENKDEQFFLYFPHTFPHIPLYASENFRGKSKAGIYGDTVEEIDWSMGEIMATVKRLGLDNKTLIMFTSDNGPWFEGAAERRGRKVTSWDGGFHVPLIARWPGEIPAGIKSDAMSMNFDIYPTLVNLAEGSIPQDRIIDGRDIWSMLQGGKESPHDVLYFFNDAQIGAVRTSDWKLMMLPRNDLLPYVHGSLNSIIGKRLTDHVVAKMLDMHHVGPFDNMDYWLLYDLKTDPNERYSMAANNPKALKKMHDLLMKGRAEFDPMIKDNPPPVLGSGEPNPLGDPAPPGMTLLQKAGIVLLFVIGIIIGGVFVLLGSFRAKAQSQQ